jgi:hypothetical protein
VFLVQLPPPSSTSSSSYLYYYYYYYRPLRRRAAHAYYNIITTRLTYDVYWPVNEISLTRPIKIQIILSIDIFSEYYIRETIIWQYHNNDVDSTRRCG